jgi:hypothetical protein
MFNWITNLRLRYNAWKVRKDSEKFLERMGRTAKNSTIYSTESIVTTHVARLPQVDERLMEFERRMLEKQAERAQKQVEALQSEQNKS